MCRIPRRNNSIFALSRVVACLLLVSGVGLSAQKSSATSQTNPAAAQSTERLQPVLLTQAASCRPDRPPVYKLLRYEEDYSYLKDPNCRTDFWDPLKYIPFGGREGWYLSLGGEIRERYEFFHNEEAGSQPADRHGNNSSALQRFLLHGDVRRGARLRFFAQSMSSLENGRIGGPRPGIDRDVFEFHQAFMDVVLSIGARGALTWRLGRQEFRYGSGRLADVREAPNVRRSFDAVRFLLWIGVWSVDGFWSKPVRNRVGVLDDNSDPQRTLWGVYAVHPFLLLPQGYADLYYLGKDRIYRLSGSLLRTGRLSRARYVGSTPALTATWLMTRHITVVASYVHFFAGPFLTETPPGKDSTMSLPGLITSSDSATSIPDAQHEPIQPSVALSLLLKIGKSFVCHSFFSRSI